MKKIYRLKEGKKVGGICAGIADMYNLDVTIVRIVAVFITVLTSFAPGIIAYLAGWYLMPEQEYGQFSGVMKEKK